MFKKVFWTLHKTLFHNKKKEKWSHSLLSRFSEILWKAEQIQFSISEYGIEIWRTYVTIDFFIFWIVDKSIEKKVVINFILSFRVKKRIFAQKLLLKL